MSDLARQLKNFTPPRKKSWIDRPGQRQTCIFCCGTPLTREHIWPVWSHDYLPKGRRLHHIIHAIERNDRSDINIRKKSGDPHDRQVRVVDERCNNGWMRTKIEDPARPILTKLFSGTESVRITEEDQRAIASWIALRAMTSEYSDFSPRITHHKQRTMLRDTQQISKKTWRIWIGHYEGRQSSALWVEHPFLLLPDAIAKRRKNRIANYANSQTLTYVIGSLLIHVMRSPDDLALRLWTFPARVGGKLMQIWPPCGLSILWPLPGLTDAEAAAIAVAFKRHLANIIANRGTFPHNAVHNIGEPTPTPTPPF